MSTSAPGGLLRCRPPPRSGVFHSTSASELGDGRLQGQRELEAAGENVALRLEVTVDNTDEALELDPATIVTSASWA